MVTAEEFRAAFFYNPATGEFTRRVKGRSRWPGMEVGAVTKGRPLHHGYLGINFRQVTHYAHRLAWLHETGQWPAGEIDHINGDTSDNRWCNLRLADRRQNLANQPKRKIFKYSQYRGVCKDGNCWFARVRVNGKRVVVYCPSELEAAKKADELLRQAHGNYARLNFPDMVGV